MQLPEFIKTDEPLSCHSTLGVGGTADYFAGIALNLAVDTTIDVVSPFLEAYEFARDNGLNIVTLGRGSNILFADAGFRGLVLHIKPDGIFWLQGQDSFWVNAGTIVATLVNLGKSSGLSGFEWAAGLPGTVGGAICGNAGCYGRQFWDLVQEVLFFDGEHVRTVEKNVDMYRYRWSLFKENPNWIIMAARLSVTPKGGKIVGSETRRVLRERLSNQPKSRSAGCIFKNPMLRGEKISAGKLIDEAGLKGMQIGQAMISREHGNFFVNLGGAKAADFIKLITIARGRVVERFSVLLEEEIIRVGEF